MSKCYSLRTRCYRCQIIVSFKKKTKISITKCTLTLNFSATETAARAEIMFFSISIIDMFYVSLVICQLITVINSQKTITQICTGTIYSILVIQRLKISDGSTKEANLLNQSSCVAPALGVTKFTNLRRYFGWHNLSITTFIITKLSI